MKRSILRLALLAAIAIITLAAADAHAVARHERVKISDVKKDGKVVGMQIKLVLHPETYEKAKVGINKAGAKAEGGNDAHRKAASGQTKHLLHIFKDIEFKEPNKHQEVTLKVLYKDAPGLNPGDEIEIVSAFNKASNASYWHVYGMTGAPGVASPDKYTAPGKEAPKRRVAVKNIRRTGKVTKTTRKTTKRSPKKNLRRANKQVQQTRTRKQAQRPTTTSSRRKQVRKQARQKAPKRARTRGR